VRTARLPRQRFWKWGESLARHDEEHDDQNLKNEQQRQKWNPYDDDLNEEPKERRERRNLEEVRERVGRWMEGRKGQKFMAGDLVREFPELDGVAVSIFMKPLVEAGKVKTDTSEGNRRMKYFVAEG
jgi:hypothetical protein